MSPSAIERERIRIAVRPPQFGLRTLLIAAAGIGLTFGVLGWFKLPPAVGMFVLSVLVLAAVATAGLVASLLHAYTVIEPASDVPKEEEQACDPFEGDSSG